jgi:hypothetical protein
MGVALMADQRRLADARIGLAQPHAVLPCQAHQPFPRAVHQPGVGREGDRLRLHGGVNDDAGEVRRLGRPGAGRQVQALLQQRDQLGLAHALAPARHRGAVERQCVAKEFFAAEQLVIGVLQPALAQYFVREVMHVLEDGEPRHQSGRQRRAAQVVGVGRAETLLEEAPIDAPRQLRQRMRKIDDLIEPRSQQIVLAAVASLRCPPSRAGSIESHQVASDQIAEKPRPMPRFPANTTT